MSGVQCLKREGCIVMLAFLGGIVLTNLLGANRQIHGQLLNQTSVSYTHLTLPTKA